MDFDSSDSEQGNEHTREDLANVQILSSAFSTEKELKIVKYARDAVTGAEMDKDAATALRSKLEHDSDFEEGGLGAWQVIVGRSYASCVTHETGYLMYFNLIKQRRTVMVFKSQ